MYICLRFHIHSGYGKAYPENLNPLLYNLPNFVFQFMLSEWSQKFQSEKLIWIVILSQLYTYFSWQKPIKISLQKHLNNPRHKKFKRKINKSNINKLSEIIKYTRERIHRVNINSNNRNNVFAQGLHFFNMTFSLILASFARIIIPWLTCLPSTRPFHLCTYCTSTPLIIKS